MKKNVLIGVIAVLLVLGIGISFAYFVSGVLVSGKGSDVTLEPGDMLKVEYDAGSSKLVGNKLMPGDSVSKDFSVIITPTTTEKEVMYGIFINLINNTFVKCDDHSYDELTNACEKGAKEITYIIKDKDTNRELVKGDLTGKSGKIKLLTEEKEVESKTVFNYTITITFEDTRKDQNHNQNKGIEGNIEVEFTELTGSEYILSHYDTILTRNDFSETVENTTTGTIYKSLDESQYDEDGEVYYFAGNPTDNWLKFAGYYWRIIRINGDGSIRMIYSGEGSPATTGTDTQLQKSAYNSLYDDNAYVGYMYGSTGASSYAATHANNNNSTIKGVLDSWYTTNIANKGYGDKVSTEAGFCNDRRIAGANETFWNSDTKKGYGTNATAYAPFSRFLTTSEDWASTQNPTLKCSQLSSDMFTPGTSSKGNKKLISPVGLITADEVVYAGGKGGSNNASYYLYTKQGYWTMSPYRYHSGAVVLLVASDGWLDYGAANYMNGVRPVINIAKDVEITGSGTSNDPFVVVGAE